MSLMFIVTSTVIYGNGSAVEGTRTWFVILDGGWVFRRTFPANRLGVISKRRNELSAPKLAFIPFSLPGVGLEDNLKVAVKIFAVFLGLDSKQKQLGQTHFDHRRSRHRHCFLETQARTRLKKDFPKYEPPPDCYLAVKTAYPE